MKYLIAPLSKELVLILGECRQNEMNGSINQLHSNKNYLSLECLYDLRLIDLRIEEIGEKNTVCIYVTEAGIDFLNKIEVDKLKAQLLESLTTPESRN